MNGPGGKSCPVCDLLHLDATPLQFMAMGMAFGSLVETSGDLDSAYDLTAGAMCDDHRAHYCKAVDRLNSLVPE